MKNKYSQRRNSRKSNWRTIRGTKDEGQRWKVTYKDGLGERRVFGYTDDVAELARFREQVTANSAFSDVVVFDRTP